MLGHVQCQWPRVYYVVNVIERGIGTMPTLELTREEIIEEMDKVARGRLQLSAAEVLRRYRADELDDPGTVGDLLILADLLDADDPIFRS